ncbi:TIGR03086 family protein [Nocardioides sp. KIGAM211]|uniref:TIGR03086 family protein n=1 Tax=Nocardioides luti TaxID=2761101 RepID=A0A7X0RIR0_9ACTN|nr:TIGR03086 family metal-binding protein [Nocardioides luti]MBB6629094.1 TIGR03086 family protein [Nocardioides luti]
MTAHESVALLSRALDQTGDVLAAVHEEHLSQPTPCSQWDVAHLVAHLVQDPRTFVAMARGEEVDWAKEPEPVTGGWAEAFREGADDLLHQWHQAGDAAEAGQVDWQTAEFAVHTWDLAQAIGHPGPLDPEVAERGLAFMSGALTDDNRSGAFGPEVPAPDGASAYERLAAFAGRTVR